MANVGRGGQRLREECQDVIVSERADQIVPPSPAEKKGGGETVSRSQHSLVEPGGAKTPTAGGTGESGPVRRPGEGEATSPRGQQDHAAHDTLEERRIEPHRHQRAEPRAEEPQGDHSGQEPPIHLATGEIVPRTEEGPQCPGEFIGGHGSGSGTPMASHAGVVSAEALPPLMPPSSAATNAMQRTRTALNAVPVHCSLFTVHRSPFTSSSSSRSFPWQDAPGTRSDVGAADDEADSLSGKSVAERPEQRRRCRRARGLYRQLGAVKQQREHGAAHRR